MAVIGSVVGIAAGIAAEVGFDVGYEVEVDFKIVVEFEVTRSSLPSSRGSGWCRGPTQRWSISQTIELVIHIHSDCSGAQ